MGKGPEQTLLQGGHTDDQQTYEKMLNVTNHQRNQIKTTMSYHLTCVRMAIINKSTNNKCQQGCGERGILLHCWWECRLVQPLWKAVQRYLNKLKVNLPFDPATLLLGLYLKKPKTLIQKNISIPVFIAVFTIAKIWKQPKCPSIDEWIKQLWEIIQRNTTQPYKRRKCYPS